MIIKIERILEVENYLQNIDAVVFDLDDTLYSETEYVRSGYKAVAQQFPQIDNMQKKLWLAFKQRKMAINEVLAKEGLLNDEMLQKCLSIYRNHQPEIQLYDGVLDMLSRIKSSGRKVGIITDGRSEGQRAKMDSLGLNDKVDYIIITDELGGIEYRKPNDKAFNIMRDKLETSFKKMMYVGDNPKKDFEAPQKLGMRSVWFQNKDGLYYAD